MEKYSDKIGMDRGDTLVDACSKNCIHTVLSSLIELTYDSTNIKGRLVSCLIKG